MTTARLLFSSASCSRWASSAASSRRAFSRTSLRAVGLARISSKSMKSSAETVQIVMDEFRGNYLAYALEASSWLVERTVRQYCHPTPDVLANVLRRRCAVQVLQANHLP